MDLAVALAVASSFRGVPLEEDTVVLGEVGLSGEVRPVPQLARRLQEAARLGLAKAIVPVRAEGSAPHEAEVQVTEVATLSQAIRAALPRGPRGATTAAEPNLVEVEAEV